MCVCVCVYMYVYVCVCGCVCVSARAHARVCVIKMHLPKAAVAMKMSAEGLDPAVLDMDPSSPAPSAPPPARPLPGGHEKGILRTPPPPRISANHFVYDGPIGIDTPSAAFPIPEKVICDLYQEWEVEGVPQRVTDDTFKEVFGVERADFASLKGWKQEQKVRLVSRRPGPEIALPLKDRSENSGS